MVPIPTIAAYSCPPTVGQYAGIGVAPYRREEMARRG